jgi:hypothetical protein
MSSQQSYIDYPRGWCPYYLWTVSLFFTVLFTVFAVVSTTVFGSGIVTIWSIMAILLPMATIPFIQHDIRALHNLGIIRAALNSARVLICISAPDEKLQMVAQQVAKQFRRWGIHCCMDLFPSPSKNYVILGVDPFTADPIKVKLQLAQYNARLALLIAADNIGDDGVDSIKYELVNRGNLTVLGKDVNNIPRVVMTNKSSADDIVYSILTWTQVSIRVETAGLANSMEGCRHAD